MESDVPHYDLALSLLVAIDSLAEYRLEPYRVSISRNTPIISGGYGTVQRGALRISHNSSAPVAVKMLRPAGDDSQRLRVAVALAREAKIWSGLDHPNITPLVGFYVDMRYDEAWLISSWEPLGNVVTFLADTQPDQDVRIRLALDTANGLAYLHNLSPSVCHGDIKGANVLVNCRRRAMWCDFGLAQVMDSGPSGLSTSRTNTGTVRYLSPELLNGTALRTPQSDVWAWGCVLREILTDRIPYEGEGSDFSVILAIAQGAPPALVDPEDPTVPEFGREALAICWSPEATGRPTMTWCSDLLARHAPDLGDDQSDYSEGDGDEDSVEDDDDAPLEFQINGPGWNAFFNPESGLEFDIDLLEGFDDIDFDVVSYPHFSPDGRTLALKNHREVRFYRVATRQLQRIFHLPTASVNDPYNLDRISSMSFDAKWVRLATGHENGRIQIRNLPGWTLRFESSEYLSHSKAVSSLAWSNSDTVLVSASADNALHVWNVETGARIYRHQIDNISYLTASQYHQFVVASSSQRAAICDVSTGHVVEAGLQPSPQYPAKPSAFTPNGQSLLIYDEGVKVWAFRSTTQTTSSMNSAVPKVDGNHDGIASLAVSSDGHLAASVSPFRGDLILWDLGTGRPIMVMTGHKLLEVSSVTFQPGSTAEEGILAVTTPRPLSIARNVLHLVRYRLRAWGP